MTEKYSQLYDYLNRRVTMWSKKIDKNIILSQNKFVVCKFKFVCQINEYFWLSKYEQYSFYIEWFNWFFWFFNLCIRRLNPSTQLSVEWKPRELHISSCKIKIFFFTRWNRSWNLPVWSGKKFMYILFTRFSFNTELCTGNKGENSITITMKGTL